MTRHAADTPAISSSAKGAVLSVRVIPRSRRSEIVRLEPAFLRVKLTAPPLAGAANEVLLRLLSRALGVRRSQIEILTGQTSRHKTVRVRGLSPTEVAQRLAMVAPS